MLTEPFAALCSTDHFAVAATWSVGSKVVKGHFLAGYEATELLSIAGIEGAGLAFVCPHSEVPTVDHGDTFTINSVVYTVVEVRPEDTALRTGFVTVALREP